MKPGNLKESFFYAAATVSYIALVAFFMTTMGVLFREDPPGVLAPIIMLTLFVISAAVTGSLVLGRPILLYLAGEREAGVRMLIGTIGCLAGILFLILLIALIVQQVA